jgi:DNA repair protein SbcC/Rad50
LDRFESLILERDKEHSTALEARSQILADVQERSKQSARQTELYVSIEASSAEFNALTAELEAFDGTVKQARELAKIARNVRTDIVRKVFDNSLNALWRDLFIRLAPSESFVPAFTLPEKESGMVEAMLETHYRSGGKGGNPRAMLSAGNLNTAALTLFLALHLSVAKKFPCLIIDDPFQSMDEVHIAQLAALMRTLSRQHGRQIIIAVHEKPLFEYLSLELFPAFPEDRLITIELGIGADGRTVPDPRVISFVPDRAISAA